MTVRATDNGIGNRAAGREVRTGRRGNSRDLTVRWNSQVVEQIREDRGITGLAGRDEDHHRQAVAVDELVDLRRQAAAGAADGVVRRL
ncbi:hypothetical protein, partial [Rhodococcus sp. (in: high G+C Gram-positive bacteria)]|uniref:hypothetical protein n=1 Tax=Rhodococcus sp. TaxID=1831 RepID=UPI003BB2179F